MARFNGFLSEQFGMGKFGGYSQRSGIELTAGHHRKPLGFQVPTVEAVKQRKASKRRRAKAEDFALLLADDAEKHPEKLIPYTKERHDRAMALLEGVELD